ncbi:hypothetical protein [Ekhidna sp. To15]|uniref:hypothetical protein n=1 Tax=Ekhidna sp. To15 TaxID=3395267 RepID=UPI003F51BAE8
MLIRRNIDLRKILVDDCGLIDNKKYRRRKKKYEFVIDLISQLQFLDPKSKANPFAFVPIRAEFLQRKLSPAISTEIVDDLLEAGIIERDYFIRYKKCYGYRLTPQFALSLPLIDITSENNVDSVSSVRNCEYQEKQLERLELDPICLEHIVKLFIDDNNVGGSISGEEKYQYSLFNDDNSLAVNNTYNNPSNDIQFLNSTSDGINPELYKTFINSFSEIDLKPVINDFGLKYVRNDNSRYDIGKFLHDYIAYGTFNSNKRKVAFKDDTSGRLHSNITRMSKRLRSFLRLKGSDEKLVLIDIKNCQIHLLNILLQNVDVNELELAKFREYTSDGKFYELLAEELSISRDKFKQQFFEYFFYCKDRGSRIKGAMYKHFPEITQFIVDYKDKDHSKLAIDLQKKEAKIMIDEVMIQVEKERGLDVLFLTIHDGVLTTESEADYMIKMIKDSFKKRELDVTFDINLLG